MTSIVPAVRERPLIGIVMVLCGVALFAMSDIITKALAPNFPIPVIMAVRYLVSLGLFLTVFAPKNRTAIWQTKKTVIVIGRGAILTLGSLSMGIALRTIPVGEATAIIYLSPIAVVILAIPVLGERVSALGWVAVGLGFAGVILIVRPSGGLDPYGVIMALLNAGCATLYHLSTRYLAKTETTVSMMFYTLFIGAMVFVALSVPNLGVFQFDFGSFALMALLGVCATGGHFLITLSYREAPASLLAPVNYVHILFSATLSWLIFDHRPDQWTAVGMGLIAIAGAGVAIYSHFKKQRR